MVATFMTLLVCMKSCIIESEEDERITEMKKFINLMRRNRSSLMGLPMVTMNVAPQSPNMLQKGQVAKGAKLKVKKGKKN